MVYGVRFTDFFFGHACLLAAAWQHSCSAASAVANPISIKRGLSDAFIAAVSIKKRSNAASE